MRLSIEITPNQHQRLKSAAALKGESIKDYVLKRTLPNSDELPALQELEKFLAPRVKSAKKGTTSSRTIDEIFDDVSKNISS